MTKKEFIILFLLGIVQTGIFMLVFQKKEQDLDPSLPIYHFDSQEKISYLNIKLKNSNFLTIEFKDDGYWLIDPVKKKADGYMMEDIKLLLQRITRDDKLDANEQNLKECGLQTPDVEASIKMTQNREIALKFGKTLPLTINGSEYVYLKLGSEPFIYQMFKPDFLIFTIPVDGWRSKKILNFAPQTVSEIKLSGLKFLRPAQIVKRDKFQDWFLTDPYQEVLDGGKIYQLFYFLQEIYAKEYVPKEKMSLDHPDYIIELTFDSGSKTKIHVQAKEADKIEQGKEPQFYVYLEGSDEIFYVESEKYSSLPANLDDFRFKVLYRFRPDELQKFEIASFKEGKLSTLVFEQKVVEDVIDGKRQSFQVLEIVEPKGILVDPSQRELYDRQQNYVQAFVQRFMKSEITSFLNRVSKTVVAKIVDVEKPECKVTFYLTNEKREFYFQESGTKGLVYVPVSDTEYEMFSVQKSYVKMLKGLHFNFYVEPIWKLDPKTVKKISLYQKIQSGDIVHFEYIRNGEEWKVDSNDYMVDTVRLEAALTRELAVLDQARIISDDPSDLGKFGLLDPLIICIIEGDNKTYKLKISDRYADDTYFATADDKLIFHIDSAVVRPLKENFLVKKFK
ncbi:MAG: DUF4340 domain-containing protein [Planctomycetes bacterium]|nr:DUF4340 domain-containing protein [Planctomycetota bacterium]